MECPFKVGDRIVSTYPSQQHIGAATVTDVSATGFSYKMDHRVNLGSRVGWYDEGRCYPLGYEGWRKLEPGEDTGWRDWSHPVTIQLYPDPDPALVVHSIDRWVPRHGLENPAELAIVD